MLKELLTTTDPNNYQNLLIELKEMIEELESLEHMHQYMAIKTDQNLGITLRCAICGETVTVPYEANISYYGTKTGGLLKKKVERLETLKYIINYKKGNKEDENINVSKIKLKKITPKSKNRNSKN